MEFIGAIPEAVSYSRNTYSPHIRGCWAGGFPLWFPRLFS